MNLMIDFGNSALKWCLWGRAGVADHGAIDLMALESGLRSLEWNSIEAVFLCSVADKDVTQAVLVFCDSLSSSVCRIREVDLVNLPVWFSLESTSREQIGKDRVMAMLGAFSEAQNYCVIDAGTACTFDYVVSGQHQGGYIIPGLALSRDSLNTKTAGVGLVEGQIYSAKLEPGRDTRQAVEHGIRMALVAACQSAIREAHFPLHRIVLTGGDSAWLAGHLSGPVDVSPNLVFEGIRRFFREP